DSRGSSLFGPLHGGATAGVVHMLERLRDTGSDIDGLLTGVKQGRPGVKLMGFGDRVYRSHDPRVEIVKATADRLIGKNGADDALLDIAKELEQRALSDDYFTERGLYPNIDFYTGLIYRAIGFPTEYFSVLFAIARLPGWIAHYREMFHDPATKIDRPRQVYTGHRLREYVEFGQR
uniref:citrate/2-methylcitrate synthase n=1 Tax=Sciscionella sediminilitoris TaxID=1445613 RepID=UPI0004DF1EDF